MSEAEPKVELEKTMTPFYKLFKNKYTKKYRVLLKFFSVARIFLC